MSEAHTLAVGDTGVAEAISSRQVSWLQVHDFVTAAVELVDGWPAAGTPAWCLLDDDDPRKVAAVLDAGQHWALRIDALQAAQAEAAQHISRTLDCKAIAAGIRRQEWRRTAGVYIPRKGSEVA
jgi:hypothetical protein